MPDITMCMGGDCPLKETCYRYKAKPSEYQYYFLEPPFKDENCDHYWDMKEISNNTTKK